MTKPSSEEEEYFAREEYEKRRKLAREQAAELEATERERLKELHWMRCPKCGDELIVVNLHAVEIDKCPSCTGMWLDAGELEQLVERHGDRGIVRILNLFKGGD